MTQPINFGFGEEEIMLRDSAARFFADNLPVEQLHALVAADSDPHKPLDAQWKPELWQQMVELGWTMLAVPEAAGGLGMGAVAVAALCEESGKAAFPSPLLSTINATYVLAACGTGAANEALESIVGGAAATLAVHNENGEEDTGISVKGDALTGTACFVQEAQKVNHFLLRTGNKLYWVDAAGKGVAVAPDAIVDLTRDQARVSFDGTAAVLLSEDADAVMDAAMPAVWTMVSADMVGAAEWQLQTTVEYAKTRKQFDRELGFFQAVKHPLVNVMIDIDQSKSLAYNAACAIDTEPDKARQYAHMAKASASDTARFASGRSVQLHGGIGFTWECFLHLYFKRQMHNMALWGDAAWHRRQLAELLMGLRGLRRIASGILLSVALVAAVAWWALAPERPPAHRVFINGQVLSMDADNTVFEALSMRGDTIDALGSSDAIMAGTSDGTIVTDLAGRTLLPGFVDAHGHFPGSGLYILGADLNSPPIGDVNSIADIQRRLRERMQKQSGADWIVGWSYDDTLIAERRHPTRHDLDAVSADRPVYAVHVSGHLGVANTRALELLGIDADSKDPEGGVIVREADGQTPAGLLEEAAHIKAMGQVVDFSALEALRMVLAASDEYVSVGVTTAQSGAVDAGMGPPLMRLASWGIVKPRLVIFPIWDSLGMDWLRGDWNPAEVSSGKAIVGPVKVVADGSIQGYTGYLGKPYHVPFKGDADYRGYPAMSRDKLASVVGDFHAAGIQLAIHGNGDAAIDDILYAFELAQEKTPADDPRMVLIHAQMAREDQLSRMKALGVTPSFFSAHTYYWGDRHRDIFMGPERAARMSPARSAESIGLRYSVHLDTPVVPMEPMQLLWSTVNRISTGGHVIGEAQRVSPMNALRAMTIDAAWQVFQEGRIGSLEPGKLADMVILDGDPLTAPDVRGLQVDETIVGGVSVY